MIKENKEYKLSCKKKDEKKDLIKINDWLKDQFNVIDESNGLAQVILENMKPKKRKWAKKGLYIYLKKDF